MLKLEAISLLEIPGTELTDLCLIWEEKLSPWLLPAQLRHLRAFGDSLPANKAHYARLLARHMALGQTGWKYALDRDAQGRSFFASSLSQAAFAYGKDAAFCLTAPFPGSWCAISIDALALNEQPDMDMLDFLRKLYPSLQNSLHFSNKFMSSVLWTAFESAYKIIGMDVLNIDLPACFPRDFTIPGKAVLHLHDTNIHFNFFISNFYLVALAACQTFPPSVSCQWLSGLALPTFPLCQSTLPSHA